MSLKNTLQNIEQIALGIPLINTFYFKRWEDTIDKIPCYIEAKIVKTVSGGYEIDFQIMDMVTDKDLEYDAVRSDTLMLIKYFFFLMESAKLVSRKDIEYLPIDDNQLTGWRAEKVNIYELNINCYS